MAIQIRRGTNSEWESNNSNIVNAEPAIATDSERFFVGTGSGTFAEFANIDTIAPPFDSTKTYNIGNVVNYQGSVYVFTASHTGAWSSGDVTKTTISDAILQNGYTDFESTTVSGDFVSFDNGAGGVPVKSMKVSVDAVQDFNGYDRPWSGGAGKNKLNFPYSSTSDTYHNVAVTVYDDGSVKLNGTSNEQGDITLIGYGGALIDTGWVGSYILTSGASTDDVTINARIRDTSAGTSRYAYSSNGVLAVATGENEVINRIYLSVKNAKTFNNLMLYPMLRLSTETDDTWQPYENICPISGWTGATIRKTGKNLLRNSGVNKVESGVTFTVQSDGSVVANGLASSTANFNVQGYSVDYALPAGTYKVSGLPSTGSSSTFRIIIYAYDKDFNLLVNSAYDSTEGTITLTKPCIKLEYKFRIVSGYNAQNLVCKPMIRLASETDATYEPYQGDVYSITWASAGTVYGGTLDVPSGVLTVDWLGVDMGDREWQYNTSGNHPCFRAPMTDRKYGNDASGIYGICSAYSWYGNNTTTGLANNLENGQFGFQTTASGCWVRDDRYTDATTFTSAVSGQYIIYQRATPQTYQLTPTQVETLLHDNNIWCDTGTIDELTYRISRT